MESNDRLEEASQQAMTASEIHSHLDRLRAERAEAKATGLDEVRLYMADLQREIEQCRHAYVRAAVVERATTRAASTGRLEG